VILASEAVPFAKTGGLADVAGALPAALGRLGHRVTLMVPRYRWIEVTGAPVDRVALQVGPDLRGAAFYEQAMDGGARAILVDCPEFYDRDALYGHGNEDYPDNAARFSFFARAALEFLARAGERPSLVHAHDWQAGLAPVYLRARYWQHPVLGAMPSVFTIHNIAFQGLFPPAALPSTDLGWELFTEDALEYWNSVSFLKGGVNFSTMITTVSRKYASEILTPAFGFGFDGIMRRRQDDLVGIRNGIDEETWNPATDPHLPAPYSIDDLAGKRDAKRAVLSAYGLPADAAALDRPLIGIISRMVDQKGLDLIAAVQDELPQLGATFVVLGTGAAHYQQMWEGLASRHPDRIGVVIGFDERLAHLIEGGSDIFLMPSRFEPCGLNQMYSLRYGTVPVVRATGGLDDTVRDYAPKAKRANGFKFEEYLPGAMLGALRRAIETYARKDVWRALQLEGMREDFSWRSSAAEYVKVYRRAIAAHAPRTAAAAARTRR